MSTYETTRAPGAAPHFFASLVTTLSDWSERRATRRALAQLTDRELDDIGLNRADIDTIVRRR